MIRITPHTSVHATVDTKRFCIRCKHARSINHGYKLDIVCTLYKHVDVVTGRVSFDNALDKRLDEQACGLGARFFEPVSQLLENPPTSTQETDGTVGEDQKSKSPDKV